MAATDADPRSYPFIASEFPPLPEARFYSPPGLRPSWDRYFMDIANQVSKRATCPRRQVGAVIVKDKRMLATGYNGSPPGLPHCVDDGCWIEDNHCVRVVHAEVNAVVQGARYGVPLEGSECYCTTLPCLGCAKVLVSAGVRRVVYGSDYRPSEHLDELGLEMEFLSAT